MILRSCVLLTILGIAFAGGTALAQDRAFTALVTDAQGIKTQVKKVRLYWEEKLDETTFVPHELTHVPVKRGAATLKVKFETIKKFEVKPDQLEKGSPAVAITLANGKTREFPLAFEVSLIGESEFGEIKVPVKELKTVLFR